MKPSEFISRLDGRYPQMPGPVVGDIETRLGNFSTENVEKIWEAFICDYTLARAPRWADVWKCAAAHGIFQRAKGIASCYKCEACGTAFSIRMRVCPKCHKVTQVSVIMGELPKRVYPGQYECGECRYYQNSQKRNLGPVCDQYGTNQSGSLKACADCICKRCCREMYALREAQDGRKEMWRAMENDLEDRKI
jgi:hypothetical protein